MPRLFRLAAIAVFGLCLTACAGLDGGPLVRPGEPVGQIEVQNRSQYTLTAVLISECSNSTYGFNRLPSGVTIPPGRSYRFTVSAGCWDVGTGLAYRDAYQRVQVRPGRVTRWGVTG